MFDDVHQKIRGVIVKCEFVSALIHVLLGGYPVNPSIKVFTADSAQSFSKPANGAPLENSGVGSILLNSQLCAILLLEYMAGVILFVT